MCGVDNLHDDAGGVHLELSASDGCAAQESEQQMIRILDPYYPVPRVLPDS